MLYRILTNGERYRVQLRQEGLFKRWRYLTVVILSTRNLRQIDEWDTEGDAVTAINKMYGAEAKRVRKWRLK